MLDPSQTYIAISVVTNATFSSGGNYDNLYIRADGSYLRILSQRDNPKLTLEIERTPNDEAVAVKTTAKFTADVASSILTSHGYTIKLTATNAHNPALATDTVVTFNATLSQLITGITDSTSAVTATFSAATDWYFLLTVSNGYETTNAYGSIPRAFANIHLAGLSTGGVAFGKFSSSTQGNPLFECEFPAIFNGGINKGAVSIANITSINSNFKLYHSGEYPRVIRMGNVVFLEGSLSPSKTLTMSSTSNQYTMCTIPEGYRPPREMAILCQGSSLCTWLLRLSTAGACILERYSKGGSYVQPASGNWLPFSAVWILP